MLPRFSDHDEPSRYLSTARALVRCPRCGAAAVAVRNRTVEARVTCIACGFAREGRHLQPGGRTTVGVRGPCSGCGLTIDRRQEVVGARRSLHVRCPGCGGSTRLPVVTEQWISYPSLPEFVGLELWLQTPCEGHVLWAYDEVHLDFLERYAVAGVREQAPGNSSLASRLPRWIKAAKNRDTVLHALGRLRQMVPTSQ